MPMKSLVFKSSHTDLGMELFQVLPAHLFSFSGSRGAIMVLKARALMAF